MGKRSPAPLPPPTEAERLEAAEAARALRAAIADPSTMGEKQTAHVDLSSPRRGEWWETWPGLPGFVRVNGRRGHYWHRLLPGWNYVRAEIVPEMIPDLEALAERGERPVQATTKWRRGHER